MSLHTLFKKMRSSREKLDRIAFVNIFYVKSAKDSWVKLKGILTMFGMVVIVIVLYYG